MNESTANNEDKAWASFQTPLSAEALREFCQDIERLFRINPFLEFEEWRQSGKQEYRFSGRNLSQQEPFAFALTLNIEPTQDGLLIRYDQGIKRNTHLAVEPAPEGSKLTITEDYSGLSEEERQTRLHEVDKSLSTWANDLQAFISLWQRWSWLAPWRWYMRRIWQPLKPMGRRIVYMFIWITIVELALIALGAAIYWNEYT